MKRKLTAWLVAMIMTFGFTAVACGSEEVVAKFVYDNGESVTRIVKKGNSLENIPENSKTEGYTFVWDVADFSSLTESITITEKKTPNEYKIYYRVESGVTLQATTQSVIYNEAFALYTPSASDRNFKYWVIVEPNTKAGERIDDGIYNIAEDITLRAEWE